MRRIDAEAHLWGVAGNNTKSHIFGDWWYQSPTWRYSKLADQRADNFTDQGLLVDRPLSEINNCLTDDYLMPFNQYNASGDRTHARFWALVNDLRTGNNSLNASNSKTPGTWFWANSRT
jgi:hypothetical protein